MYMLMFISLILLIILLICLINYFISMIKNKNLEKKTPFECGFNPISKSNIPFSLPFYLITLMFLIFDVEIILLLPMIFFLNYLNYKYIFFIYLFFLNILLFTLIIEYLLGYLNWNF